MAHAGSKRWHGLLRAGLLAVLCVAAGLAAAAETRIVTGQWVHAIAAYGTPKYPPGFAHFDYVNPAAPKGGTLRLSNPDRRASFDKYNPYTLKGVAPAAMTMLVFEPLATFSMDEPQSMYGLLAEAMFVAPDLRAVSFRLHPLARFSNGKPVTAADVVHSFTQLTGKAVSPATRQAFADVAGATAVDARTVRFELKQPKLELVFTLGDLPVFSRDWGIGKGGVAKPFDQVVNDEPIATGPYTISRAEMPRRLELKRNPNYWARDLGVRRGHFNFEHIVYRMYKDNEVRREAFKAGEFDILREMRASQFARGHQGPKWDDGRIVKKTFEVATGSMLQAMDFNLRRPKFQDIRVREAIMRAWDFEKYNRYGMFSRANSIFNNTEFAAEGLPSAGELALLAPFRAELPKEVFGPPFRAPRNDTHPGALRENLKRAAELLAEAGWKVAPDGRLRNAAGQAFEIEYLEPSQPSKFSEFPRNLEKLGIKFTERLVDYALYRTRLEKFDFDMITIVEGKFTLPEPADLKALYGSQGADEEGGSNLRGVKSRAVDALVERIAQATTMDDLRTAARALDRVVMWNHWQIPELYMKTEMTSYWNRFGMPAVQPRYFNIDSLPDVHSLPWPLWTWWDKSLLPSAAPVAPATAR